MKQVVFVILLFALSFCSSKGLTKKDVEIVIEFAESNKIDLKNRIYTTYFMAKPPAEIKFSLTKEETEKIESKYQLLNVNSNTSEIILSGKCTTIPKLFTSLYITSGNQRRIIRIDDICKEFEMKDSLSVKTVIDFIKVVRDIIYSKNEIKSAENSDILYY